MLAHHHRYVLALCVPLALVVASPTHGAEHPRLIVGPAEVARVRASVSREPYRSMLAAVRKELATPKDVKSIMYDFRPRDLATLYLATGEREYASRAEQMCLQMVRDAAFWNNGRSKGLTRAAGAVTVALAYDACHDEWAESSRTLVSRELLEMAQGLMKSMGKGANTSLANNWQAVRYGATTLSALATDEDGGAGVARSAYGKLKAHLNANLGDNGWNPEGIGYTIYPWMFTGPAGIAAQRAGVGDLRKETGRKVAMTLWTVYAGTVAIEGRKGLFGTRADFSDDHPNGNPGCVAAMSFHYCPDELQPAVKWAYDHLVGNEGDRTYGVEAGGGLYAMLLYPDVLEARNPAEVAGVTYEDRSHGIALFRNAFRDENDIVAVVNAHSRQPRGCHGGPDTNTFRIQGLGGFFVTGGGRTGNTAGQTNLFPGSPPRRGDRGLGRLEKLEKAENGSGVCVTTGSCMGTQGHRRVFAVDYSGRAGAPAVFVNSETSSNGKLWRLNTPEFNRVTPTREGFLIKSPNGSSLACTIVTPSGATLRQGTVERGGGLGHAGFPYRGTKYGNNRYVEFDCAGEVLVVMTVQSGAAPRASASGGAKSAEVTVGGQTYRIDGDAVAFEKTSTRSPGRTASRTSSRSTPRQGTRPGPSPARRAEPKHDSSRLLVALRDSLEAGKTVRFRLSSMRLTVKVVSADPDGKLRLAARSMQLSYDISRLKDGDLASLANALGE